MRCGVDDICEISGIEEEMESRGLGCYGVREKGDVGRRLGSVLLKRWKEGAGSSKVGSECQFERE